jgi:hypothetical protein
VIDLDLIGLNVLRALHFHRIENKSEWILAAVVQFTGIIDGQISLDPQLLIQIDAIIIIHINDQIHLCAAFFAFDITDDMPVIRRRKYRFIQSFGQNPFPGS